MRSSAWLWGSSVALVSVLCGSCSSAEDAAPGTEPAGASGGAGSGGLSAAGGSTSGGGLSSTGGVVAAGGVANGGSAGGVVSSGGTPGSGGGSGGTAPGSGGGGGCLFTSDVSIDDTAAGSGVEELDFSGTWMTSADAVKFGGSDHYSSTTGDTMTFRFVGTELTVYGAHASHHGIAEIRVDGGTAEDADLYAATRDDASVLWHGSGFTPGLHTVEVSVSGRKNAASSGTTVAVDRVVFTRSDCGVDGGTGGAQGDGGAVGSGGSSSGGGTGTGGNGAGGTTVTRPAYNTGTGFFVVGRKLYDANGAEFRIRGVNKLHWDASSPGIPKTHANTERWVIDFSQSSQTNLGLMKQSLDSHIVPMPGNWAGTCDEKTSTLTSMVDTWVAQAATWKTLEHSMILNIANEWGPSGTAWRDAYITAIGRLREAGYRCTISVTSGGCGQDNADLATYAKAVFDSDPQKNVIFDQHIYGNWASAGGQSWQTNLSTGLDALVATGLAVIVGEFGPGRNIGPSATNMTPGEIIQACESRGIGWLAWAWDDPANNADDTWFALSKNGDYTKSDDLTIFGKDVVENPTYGLLALAKPATIF